MWYNVYCAISKYPNMYCTAQFATEGWSGRDMSNVIVKENESLDSALRRFIEGEPFGAHLFLYRYTGKKDTESVNDAAS